jgi:hypothetical protein
MELADVLVKAVMKLAQAIWRAVNVKRRSPEESHTAVEYADAFLFPEDHADAPQSSQPLSIVEVQQRKLQS